MSDQQATASGSTGIRTMAWILSCYLIAAFFWRVFTPVHEYPMRSAQVLKMVIDLGMIVGLIGLRAQIPKPLYWIALIAGTGLFAIRLNGDASWWTGHLMYSLSPR